VHADPRPSPSDRPEKTREDAMVPTEMDEKRFDRMVGFVEGLQDTIVARLEAIEADHAAGSGPARFRVDDWSRPAPDLTEPNPDKPLLGGGGRTRVLEDGRVFEKAGVNVSRVWGRFSSRFAGSMPGEGRDFRATGISIVIHPRNPYVPTVHMNYRRLERGVGMHIAAEADGLRAGSCTALTGWYGGGADLTPHYLFEEDARHFHRVHQAACDTHPHVATKESENATTARADAAFAFVQDAGRAFLDAYVPIVDRRVGTPWGEDERRWQLVRRGRYVEFNLVYDRGTVFGLKTGGRIESILMSLPTAVSWRYRVEPAEGSPEARLLEALRTPRAWV
jgi:coproporphyrinogen III oxidase